MSWRWVYCKWLATIIIHLLQTAYCRPVDHDLHLTSSSGLQRCQIHIFILYMCFTSWIVSFSCFSRTNALEDTASVSCHNKAAVTDFTSLLLTFTFIGMLLLSVFVLRGYSLLYVRLLIYNKYLCGFIVQYSVDLGIDGHTLGTSWIFFHGDDTKLCCKLLGLLV